MDTNEHELMFKKEVFDVVECAIEVLKHLGHGDELLEDNGTESRFDSQLQAAQVWNGKELSVNFLI